MEITYAIRPNVHTTMDTVQGHRLDDACMNGCLWIILLRMPEIIRTTLALAAALPLLAGPRARQLGVPFEGSPGPLNAITDVAGLEVGHITLISGDGGQAVRTGVTAVWPRGKQSGAPVFGGWFSLNGNGEMTGTTWLEESGLLDGPVLITNTHSVGTVRDSYIKWRVARARQAGIESRRRMVAARGGRDLGRISERHQRIPRQGGRRFAAIEAAAIRTCARGQRRRRHRHGLLRIQGRHRHELPRGRGLHGRACWCSATADGARSFASRARRWARRSRATCRTRAILPKPDSGGRSSARSSSWWPPTRRCCRTR